jgi:hypothetical protein
MNYHPDMIQSANERRAALEMARRKAGELFEILAALHQATGKGKPLADAAWDLIDDLEDAR